MAEAVKIQRPQRWDAPFSPDMTAEDVTRILSLEPFSSMRRENFPASASLEDIILNDTRLLKRHTGDIVFRAGDYGSSAFLVISGKVHVVVEPALPEKLLGRREVKKRSLWSSISQIWTNSKVPEARDPEKFGLVDEVKRRGFRADTRIFLQDVPGILNEHNTVVIGEGETFGEIAALGRIPRTATVFVEGDTELLEIRWQGFRDIRSRDEAYKKHIDQIYRERGLASHLQQTKELQCLDAPTLEEVARCTVFESYGSFDWHSSYRAMAGESFNVRLGKEPVIVKAGDYADHLILIRAGFCRVTENLGDGERTVNYLGKGDSFGFEEVIHNAKHDKDVPYQLNLRALGYVDVLVVPASAVEQHVLPNLSESELPQPLAVDEHQNSLANIARHSGLETDFMEFMVENRFINGTATMVIDTNKCVRCDDCVRACASTHNGNPRFLRHGKQHGNHMIANACMHCVDPTCLIGCPTGAIHRSDLGGQVVINDNTCIGCGTCAASCPYHNIRLVEINDQSGLQLVDEASQQPIRKATKCDLCMDQLGGPACQRACPHDALHRVNMRDLGSDQDWMNQS
ncbi:cyclic nucleotide-binding domain-containing protein [Sneathiella sp. P13V-1]|uniref:cyclic nucleotide-binding domain-containing protein n=1 Tax=Sneathiella sp. P13V-1 TaxID=2697366 RepID=UPI00187B838B|nr:cyclic nucleotide-binding domain-containing protein [Sneathiella sp. P13V-1]MBE7635907.1 cyclic nucleotide-binding domain-containing protein [Sneathiella sp. P13V-1]